MKIALRIILSLALVWLSGCRDEPSVAQTGAGAQTSTTPVNAGALEVTYLANEGFMLAGGGKKVLIDALFGEGLKGYAVVSPAQRALLEGARAPFADVDVVCATHFHGDHFNAEPVLAHLTNNPQAWFFSTPQAADKLKATGKYDAIKTRVIAALRDGDFQPKWARIKAEFPNAVYLARELDQKSFD